jgi:hypothetical protein
MHCHRSDYLPTNPMSHRLSNDRRRRLFQWPWDAHIVLMGGWSMSLTRFGAAKLRAAVRAMPKQYEALGCRWLLYAALQALQAAPENNLCDSPRYSADSRYIQYIIARHGLLSVTESVALPPQPKGG